MPILAKAGCNSGACHGAASGKKGFKVSLRGYDPVSDYRTLTRGTDGRRLNFNDPDTSLLVLKPTGLVPHEGGKRSRSRAGYPAILRRWIAEGAGSDVATAPRLTGHRGRPEVPHVSRAGQGATASRHRPLQRRQQPRCHRRRPLQQQQRQRRWRGRERALCRCRPRARPQSWSATAKR